MIELISVDGRGELRCLVDGGNKDWDIKSQKGTESKIED